MSNKYKIELTEETLNKYSNLVKREISLSTTGMSSRVFNYCKNNELIDYNLNVAPGKRGRVKLNFFEAFWVTMIQELRGFNLSDKFIINLKEFLHVSILKLYDDNNSSIKDAIHQVKKKQLLPEDIEQELVPDEIVTLLESIPEDEKIYTSLLGSFISSLILTDHSPILHIYHNKNEKTKEETPLVIKIDSPLSDPKKLAKEIEPSNAAIVIPLRPIYEHLFDLEISDDLLLKYRLLTDREEYIISKIREGDFKECVVKNVNNKLVTSIKNDGEIKGEKVKEIRKILGIKDYKTVTLKFRNDKHIYYENEK